MAELLVLAKAGYTNPDSAKDRQGCYKKGDIVHVAEDGHTWGLKEAPPDFVIVKIPGPTRAQAEQYRDHWMIDPQFAVVSNDPATDTFTIQISNANPGSANQAGLTQAMVESFLNNWGATVQGFAANQVTCRKASGVCHSQAPRSPSSHTIPVLACTRSSVTTPVPSGSRRPSRIGSIRGAARSYLTRTKSSSSRWIVVSLAPHFRTTCTRVRFRSTSVVGGASLWPTLITRSVQVALSLLPWRRRRTS